MTSKRRARAIMTWAMLATTAVSCRPADAPLYDYNRSWQGELRLRDRTLPLRVRLYVLPADRADAVKDPAPGQRIFAELDFGALGPIAASGTASHHDWTDRGTNPPHLPRREFVELGTDAANSLVDESEHPPSGEPYSKRYEALLALVGSKSDMPHGKLVFVGELAADRRIDGVVFLDETAQGDCVRTVGGKCDMWNVRFTETKIGTFTAQLDASPAFVPVENGVVETASFRFSRETEGSDVKSWTVKLRHDVTH